MAGLGSRWSQQDISAEFYHFTWKEEPEHRIFLQK